MKTALLIIDVQNDYFPGGKMELYKSLQASLNIKELLTKFRKISMPVIHIKHVSVRPDATFFIPNTPGIELNENVKPAAGEKIIEKNYPNSFRNTELEKYLKENNITKLIIAGMMTHMCVDSTVRAAFDLGYDCYLIAEACATKALSINNIEKSADDIHYSFLAALNGIFCKVITKNEALKLI